MNAFLALVRAVYFVATVVLFGELVFRLCVERAALRRLPGGSVDACRALQPRSAILATALAAAFVSSVLWFFAQVQVMSGMPLPALNQDAIRAALFDTEFGRVSLVRFGLAFALAIALALSRKEKQSDALAIAGGVIALGLLSSIAWTGHANAEQGPGRIFHLSSDVTHLFASGVWLGALPALALVLFRVRRDASARALELAALATRRFSILGIAAVSTLALTGVVNAWYTVDGLPAMLGTDYGRLLSLKLLLFGAMLVLAAMNRFRYTPQLLLSSYRALTRLGANALGEIALGVAVLCIVGVLGIATPGAHLQTVWPFRYTFSLEAARESSLSAAACLAVIAASIILASSVFRRRRFGLACAAGVATAALSALLFLLAVPANPTTYFRSPVRYSAESIAFGARLYAKQCSICHGPQGRGDGPAATAFAERPTDLIEHVLHHRQGDLFWWIAHGIPGTPMPAFEGRISETHVWDLINLLRARAEAEEAKQIGNAVHSRAVEAPDFNFQIGRDRQESLSEERGRSSVLLVLFDPVESLGRVHALSDSQSQLQQAGLRIIAIPTRAEGTSAPLWQEIKAPIVAGFDQRMVSAYSIFAPRNPSGGERPELKHAEFLIDRQGYLRARWTPEDDPAWLQVQYLTSQVLVIDREKPRSAGGDAYDHAHH